MQTAMKTKKPRKQAVSGCFWAKRTYRGRIKDDHKIDPCCGSGHIAVYLFDVLMQIYETQGWTQREAAQSIVKHNLYALDIDDRAAQLAYFAVMMKARQYDRRFFTRGVQPHVYAIPEWDEVIRDVWSDELKNICNLFRDGKEYGSIIDMPDMDWNALCEEVSAMSGIGQISMYTISEQTQEQLYNLIDVGRIMAQRYDVVITNPPYLGSGRFNAKLNKYVRENYADVKSDLSMVLFKHAVDDMAKPCGFVSFITTTGWMFLPSFSKLRTHVSKVMSISSLVDFGTELFDGKVGHNQIVSWVVRNIHISNYTMTAVRLVDYCYSRSAEKEPEYLSGRNIYTAMQDGFSNIPGSPIAYWVSNNVINAFRGKKIEDATVSKCGMGTSDNARFLRLWFEVSNHSIGFTYNSIAETHDRCFRWMPYDKGGDYRKWYGNQYYVVNFYNNGEDIREATKDATGGRVVGTDYYFKQHVSWSDITLGTLAFRWFNEGFIFDACANAVFADKDALLYLLAFANTKIVNQWSRILNPTIHFKIGNFQQLPYPSGENDAVREVSQNNITMCKDDWDSFEISWDFQVHPLIRCAAFSMEEMRKDALNHIRDMNYIEEAFVRWNNECFLRFQQLKANEEELNRIFIDIYGLQDELTPEVEDKDVTVRRADLGRDIRSLISYAVGCMFGRYSLNKPGLAYAGGKWEDVFGTLQEPWETGNGDIITTNAGEPIEFRIKNGTIKHNGQEIKLDYRPDDDNCLPITDEDYGLKDDVVNRFVDFIRTVYGEATLEDNLDFIARALGNKGDTSRDVIRNYFLNDFFKDHCQTYSVTGSGKRPIYWLFDSGKANGFKALVYMHRWTADTVGNLRVEYLHRMQRVYEKEIERMQDTIDNARDSREVARATKRREKLVKQLKEARDYDAKIAHVALSRVEIDLDDGVKVNYEKVQKGPDGKSLGILAKI